MEINKISIPKGWRKVSIGECVVEKKKSPIKVDDAANFGLYPFFTSGEAVLQHDCKLIDGENLYLATGGMANVKYFNGEAAYSTDTYVLGTKENICPKFMYYVLLFLKQYIDINYFQGSGLKHLQKKDFKHHEIIIPESKDEQQRIADALSILDDSLLQTQSLIDKYESIKRGLMQDLLTYGIDNKGNVRSEKTHKFKDSPLGRIPEEWECVEMFNLMDAIDAQPDHRTPAEVEDGVPYVGISDIDDYGNLIIEKCRRVGLSVVKKQKSIFTIDDGDIIFGKIGTIGKPKMLPILNDDYAISANVIVIKPKENTLYLYYSLKSEYVDKEVDLSIHSTSQPAFGMEKIRSLMVKKPLKDEQAIISETISQFDDYIHQNKLEFNKLSSTKQGLLSDLITGKVRI